MPRPLCDYCRNNPTATILAELRSQASSLIADLRKIRRELDSASQPDNSKPSVDDLENRELRAYVYILARRVRELEAKTSRTPRTTRKK